MAFLVSGLAVVAAVPATAAWPQPNLPGFVLVATGVVASLIARCHPPARAFRLPMVLVGLGTVLVAAHLLAHRLGFQHGWLDPIYLVAVAAYVVVAIGQAFVRGFR